MIKKFKKISHYTNNFVYGSTNVISAESKEELETYLKTYYDNGDITKLLMIKGKEDPIKLAAENNEVVDCNLCVRTCCESVIH